MRLLVATPDGMLHARFADLPRYLAPGDLLVVNTSATVAAAVPDGAAMAAPVAGALRRGASPTGTWLVELRAERGAAAG